MRRWQKLNILAIQRTGQTILLTFGSGEDAKAYQNQLNEELPSLDRFME